MENVLLISPFFFPEPISTGKYNAILAKELSVNADSVDVLCGHPMYPKWVIEPTTKEIKGVETKRGGKWLKFPSNALLRRAVLEVWFCFFVFLQLTLAKKKYSHIVPVFPPSLFMLLVPFFKKKAKIIGIVHDLQGVYANRGEGVIKKSIFSAIKWVERKAFNSCDSLIFLSEDMMNLATTDYGLNPSKNSVHYPFVTISKFENFGRLSSLIPDEQKSLVYSGALGEKQAPRQLAEFMEQMVLLDPSINAYIFSQGPEFEKLKKEFENIAFYPLVDESDLPEMLLRSTVQVLPQAMGNSDGSLPSKLPNLLASGCKVMCITDEGSELVRILELYSNACVAHSWESTILTQKCLSLMSLEANYLDDKEFLEKFYIASLIN